MAHQGRTPERAGRDFLKHGFPRNRFDFVNDIVTSAKAIEFLRLHSGALLGIAAKRPGFNSDSVHAGDVNDRDFYLTCFSQKLLTKRQSTPPSQATTPRPSLDRL